MYAAGIFTHLLDIGLSHEPYCHILMNGTLSLVPESSSRLVAINGDFEESLSCEGYPGLAPAIMIDLATMDLIEFEIVSEDLLSCLSKVDSVSNKLSILHYFLVHLGDFESVEEVKSFKMESKLFKVTL